MTESELRRAIEEPARRSGLLLEPGLVDLLVRDVLDEAGGLPLMSHALAETWARRDGNVLTVEGYTRTGGIRGAVAQSAERLYESLSTSDRAGLRAVLHRLVSPMPEGDPVAARVPTRVFDGTEDAPRLLDLLVRARLVTTSSDSVTIAHESLVRAWPRLRFWLDEDVEGQRILRTCRWRPTAGTPTAARRRALPRRAAAHRPRVAGPVASRSRRSGVDFLAASSDHEQAEERRRSAELEEQKRRNRQLRYSLGGVAGLLVLALVAGTLAAVNGRRAQDSHAASGGRQRSRQPPTPTLRGWPPRPWPSLGPTCRSSWPGSRWRWPTPRQPGQPARRPRRQSVLSMATTPLRYNPTFADNAFSPDGTRALVDAYPDGSTIDGIYLLDPATGHVLTDAPLVDPYTMDDLHTPTRRVSSTAVIRSS